ncbi:MAG: hypothetical protein LLG04_08315, partial [Parachlamydia sp.]|nr:hypothetical protein [Parachlamydia sp.]
ELERVYKFCKDAMEAQDIEGNTPLLTALKKEKQANASWLLSQGAKGDCMNTAKETPYSVALAKQYDQFLKLLADKGIKS